MAKPIEHSSELPEPDADDTTLGAPEGLEPEQGDIATAGHLDDADEGR